MTKRMMAMVIVAAAITMTACGESRNADVPTAAADITPTAMQILPNAPASEYTASPESNAPTATPAPMEASPAPLQTETAEDAAPSRDFMIAIDPGHQARGNSEHEPIGPGASQSKPKVSSGTQGVATTVPEYKLTLAVSLKLRDELLARGYNVFMIRETHEVDISNKERAVGAAEAGADILVRIHADGSANSGVNGILLLCPTAQNPFVADLYTQSRALSDHILAAMLAETGAQNRGILEVDNMSGINWSSIPVTIVEMGLMTNPDEDRLMQTEAYQLKLSIGMANGIEQYFAEQSE